MLSRQAGSKSKSCPDLLQPPAIPPSPAAGAGSSGTFWSDFVVALALNALAAVCTAAKYVLVSLGPLSAVVSMIWGCSAYVAAAEGDSSSAEQLSQVPALRWLPLGCLQLVSAVRQGSSSTQLPVKVWVVLEAAFWGVGMARAAVAGGERGANVEAVEAARRHFPRALRADYWQRIVDLELGGAEGALTPAQVEAGRDWIASWFHDTEYKEIRSGNLTEWLAWVWFDTAEPGMLRAEDKEEIHRTQELIEARLGRLRPGYNPAVVVMRNSSDAMQARTAHRPLVFYFCTDLLLFRIAGPLGMRALGFTRHSTPHFAYWHRAAQGGEAEAEGEEGGSEASSAGCGRGAPVVFMHGIGIGVVPYLGLVRQIAGAGRAVCVPEQPHVALTLSHYLLSLANFKVAAPQVAQSLVQMLTQHEWRRAEFVGHSYGTLPVAWMVKWHPEVVSRVTLIDPVCLFLHRSDVCDRFLYRTKPPERGGSCPNTIRSSMAPLLSYVVNREPGLVHTLMRNFQWAQNTLWTAELLQVPSTPVVVLSELDEYVPSREIRDYITAVNQAHDCSSVANGPVVRLIMNRGSRHAEFLLPWRRDLPRIVESIVQPAD